MRQTHGPTGGDTAVQWGTPAARWVLTATVLGSGLAFLDATSSNVALPAIGTDLDTGVAALQWTINGYTLTLAALILLGGSLGDRFGRRRIFVVGTVWFAAASLLCGLAPNAETLIAARALQGVGGALLTPGSLAILQTSFAPEDRARAVGAWSGLSGIAAALGPMIGGLLVDLWTWRLIFLTNIPVAAVVVAVAVRHVPESREAAPRGFDVPGVVLAVVGLAATTWALIAIGEQGLSTATVVAGVGGVAVLVAFLAVERRSADAMMPPAIFASRQFTGANIVTFAVYAVLGGMFFLLFLQLQQVLGYSPLVAGAAALPVTGLLLVLSAWAGAFAERVGPRLPMTVGPLIIAVGLLLHVRIDAGAGYLTAVLPAVAVFGLGLAITVAPLTATVLAAVDRRFVGVASGVNNAVSRWAGLLAVAVLPVVAGLTGETYTDPEAFAAGFRTAMIIAAAVAAAGGLAAWTMITDELREGEAACPTSALERQYHCAVDGPALATADDAVAVIEGGGDQAD
jgi:EmrB/QacA subfamily drug resistance transporter